MSSLYVLYDNLELNLRARRATPLVQLLKQAATSFGEWNQARIARRELNEMPEYMLNDIGIDRREIRTVVSRMAVR
ncbi:MAG: hypothetical protein DHS20C01_04480 [marine bacterium B5-7]|nr:MAG: hypothetical protein DHS20C01_04480 [marine bacterium B5-7]